MNDYELKLARESRHWGDHLSVEAAGEWNAWLDHPLIAERYRRRSLIDGKRWEEWVKERFSGPAARSLDLGCGAGMNSLRVFASKASARIEGIDISEERVRQGEKQREEAGAPGGFRVADVNNAEFEPDSYDLIFSCHSFHHFLHLERIMEQTRKALTSRGLFVLEEYVGPTQFQWTDEQMEIVRALLGFLPDRMKTYRWGAIKEREGRPAPAEVEAVSPFEAIRSAEILPLFEKYFDVVVCRKLGGTIQHLLYNGIMHNFVGQESVRLIEAVCGVEDALIDEDILPSDFMLLAGCRKRGEDIEADSRRLTAKDHEIKRLQVELEARERELEKIKGTMGWRMLSGYGRIKHRFLLPVYRRLTERKKNS
jgi:SAM-dependent methyltransferase